MAAGSWRWYPAMPGQRRIIGSGLARDCRIGWRPAGRCVTAADGAEVFAGQRALQCV